MYVINWIHLIQGAKDVNYRVGEHRVRRARWKLQSNRNNTVNEEMGNAL